jgi:hypothetical protein
MDLKENSNPNGAGLALNGFPYFLIFRILKENLNNVNTISLF